jgi:hypothetical protein
MLDDQHRDLIERAPSAASRAQGAGHRPDTRGERIILLQIGGRLGAAFGGLGALLGR